MNEPNSGQITLAGISKNYGRVSAVNDLSLAIAEGECLALLGPSGCGKTTILRMLAGLENPDRGKIFFHKRDITSLAPEARNIGLVFQNYALFPHLSVAENVAYGLQARKKPRPFIIEKVAAALALVQLDGYGERRINELSGGQQQRVAIARALAIEPELLLLDEPLSNLDVSLREQTREQLRALIERLKITTIFVTHDQEDAFSIADRVALLNKGELQQHGRAAELYFHPANIFVAQFVGRSNLLPATVIGNIDQQHCEYRLADGFTLIGPATDRSDRVMLRIRPEAIKLFDQENGHAITAKIAARRFAGATIHYQLDINGVKLQAIALTNAEQHNNSNGICKISIPLSAISIIAE